MSCRHYALVIAASAALPLAAAAQMDPLQSFNAPAPVDSGAVVNDTGELAPVFSTEVFIPDATWLRLFFDDVELAGTPGVDGSYLMIYSLDDGAWQRLDAEHVENWSMSSAYFNGDTVYIELWAHPDTGPNRFVMSEVEAGEPNLTESICDGQDDRDLSYDQRVARMSTGCTAWLIDHDNSANRFMTAGHCIGNNNTNAVMFFNVPLSTSNGNFRAPRPAYPYPVEPGAIQSTGSGGVGNDAAIFQTRVNSNTGLAPRDAQGAAFNLANPPASANNQPIRVTGHGVRSGAHPQIPPEWSTAQKTHVGPLTQRTSTTLRYRPDTTGGNSGSPVILDTTGDAIGVHSHGGCSSTGGSNAGTAMDQATLQSYLNSPQGTNIQQQPLSGLTTLFDSNNGGSAGGAVYFDVGVNSYPIHVRTIELNTNADRSTEFDVEVYITPGTSEGNQTDPSAWTKVGEGRGLAFGTDEPTRIVLHDDFVLDPDQTYGVAVVVDGVAHRYTNGDGENEFYNNSDMFIAAGSASNSPFSGSVFNDRVFNGSFGYRVMDEGLISNLPGNDDTGSVNLGNGRIKGMGFTMPADENYLLEGVKLRLNVGSSDVTPLVRLFDDDDGVPGDELLTFNNPPLTTGTATHTFSTNMPFVLDADETYWVVAYKSDGLGRLDWLASDPAVTPVGEATDAGSVWSGSAGPGAPTDPSAFLNSYAMVGRPIAGNAAIGTDVANNGSGGVYMNLSADSQPLDILSFDVAYTGSAGSIVEVEVWTRDGEYQDFISDPAGWTLHDTLVSVRLGTNRFSRLLLSNEIEVDAGQTKAVYLHAVSEGGGIRYNGTAANPPQVDWSNDSISLFSDTSRTGNTPFGGSSFSPRAFSGAIGYEVGDAPSCPPDLNGDGVVDADDFFLFLQLFADGDPRADFNNDGVIDADDFFAFLAAFAAGC
ncbi:MAG: trypsin-like peptidase domain-containing protein [Phycisphaerales bacterium]|nr:trypsin-like peptidase domain-containing protein [Phycisphaerales bacterium]